MEEQIRALLRADPQISALVAGRVNFGVHPQGAAWPGLVLNVISDLESYDLQGPAGLGEARLQVDCYAESYGSAKILSRQVRAVLGGYSAGTIRGVFLAGARDGRAGGSDGAAMLYRVSLDFNVTYAN